MPPFQVPGARGAGSPARSEGGQAASLTIFPLLPEAESPALPCTPRGGRYPSPGDLAFSRDPCCPPYRRASSPWLWDCGPPASPHSDSRGIFVSARTASTTASGKPSLSRSPKSQRRSPTKWSRVSSTTSWRTAAILSSKVSTENMTLRGWRMYCCPPCPPARMGLCGYPDGPFQRVLQLVHVQFLLGLLIS